MDKENLAYKLTADVLKKYDLSILEEKYQMYGGKLISTIFNEIYSNLNVETDSSETSLGPQVIIYGENEIPE